MLLRAHSPPRLPATISIVVDAITAEGYKTKVMVEMLKAVGAKKKALVVLADNDSKVVGSLANIEGVKTAQYKYRQRI